MSILVDQCVPRKFRRLLREWGYKASLVQEHIKPESPDSAVIALAQKLDSVLLTVDMDFANLLDYPPQNYQGIIVMRYRNADEEDVINILKQALQALYRDHLRGALVIVTASHYRVRRSK
jgi:predicted nuclease of predicted toxin-antitoxin system